MRPQGPSDGGGLQSMYILSGQRLIIVFTLMTLDIRLPNCTYTWCLSLFIIPLCASTGSVEHPEGKRFPADFATKMYFCLSVIMTTTNKKERNFILSIVCQCQTWYATYRAQTAVKSIYYRTETTHSLQGLGPHAFTSVMWRSRLATTALLTATSSCYCHCHY